MDRDAFDNLTRRLASAQNRRSVLGIVVGSVLAAIAGSAPAAKRKQKPRRSTERPLTGPCGHPGRSSNLDGCNFDDARFEGIDLSSSSMRGTTFRQADLCGANLGSSHLQNADFRNANLTKATLRSSSCEGTVFADATLCGTTMCDGTVRDDDCPDNVDPNDVCCGRAGCGAGRVCCNRRCQPGNCCFTADCGPNAICDGGICRNCNVCADGCQFTSMRDAIRLSGLSATLYVCPGRYFGGFSVPEHVLELNVIGAGSGDGGTVFDGSHDDFSYAHIVVASERVTLRDVRITGHVSWNIGGGLLTTYDANVILRRVRIDRNHGQYGGGIFNYGYAILEEGTIITGNSAAFGGGGVFNQGVLKMNPGSQISGNSPNDCSGPGQGCPPRKTRTSRAKRRNPRTPRAQAR